MTILYYVLPIVKPEAPMILKAVEMGMPGVAIMDHGNMFGAIEFYEKAVKNGIKPLIGQEFYISPSSGFDKSSCNKKMDRSYHLILIAKDNTGYQNIIKLSSIGYTEGFYHKPKINLEVLEKYNEGLICLSACIKGEIPQLLIKGKEKEKEASQVVGKLSEIFNKDRFYLEIMDHGIPQQKKTNKGLISYFPHKNI